MSHDPSKGVRVTTELEHLDALGRVGDGLQAHGEAPLRARQFGGGGHKNASGFSASGELSAIKSRIQTLVLERIDKAHL